MNGNQERKRVVVTGVSGFIGQNLLNSWKEKYELVPVSFSNADLSSIPVNKNDVIVHLAGIAHQIKKTGPDIYYDVNYKKTIAFAKICREKGADHFIYMSSTKVYGGNDTLYNESSPCASVDAYGKSKLLAEKELAELQSPSFVISIMRPPLVYGPGVKGNMLKLLRLCSSGKPLPFKGLDNKRTIVYVRNLIAMLERIIEMKTAGIFIPADDHPLSTFEMLQLIKQDLGTNNREIAVPSFLIKIVSKMFPGMGRKIFGSLIYDNLLSNQTLHFANPYKTADGFKEMADWFKQTQVKNQS
jgi:nucleoside-diphosphate-sugar epimerase